MKRTLNWQILILINAVLLSIVLIGYLLIQNYYQAYPDVVIELQRANLVIGGVLIGLANLTYLLIYLRVFRPLSKLSDSIKRIVDGEDDVLEIIPYGYELGRLSLLVEVLINVHNLHLKDSESESETLRSVLNQITDGIVMVNEEGYISSMNPAAETIFQTSEEEALGHSVAEVLRQHQWIELWRSASETETEASATLEIPPQKTFLQGIGIPLGESLPGYILLLFQDLSHIRRLETTRQDFISNISHELRTPLASLKALAETLHETALEDPDAAKRFLARMDTELDALTQLVAELLELSRIESGRVPLDLKAVFPTQLLSQAYERMRTQAERKLISIEMNAAPNLPEIEVDPRKIEQVMVNLLHNAIKFSDRGSQILLAAEEKPDAIQFSVKDRGSGIPEADLERIFERFYKTDQARAGGGTGLGLSIARHIVEAHQGLIWADSTLNEGSTFYFSIPKNHL